MLNLKSIHVHNFRTIEDAHFTFEPGVTLVRGRITDSAFSDSNGAGKSSLFTYSIPYALYGKYITSTGMIERTNIVRENQYEGYVSLSFSYAGKEFEVRRGRRKDKPFLELKGADTPSVSSAGLDYLVGCSFEDFISLFILTRFAVERSLFIGGGSKRRDFIMSLVGLERASRGVVDLLKRVRAEFMSEADALRLVLSETGVTQDLEQYVATLTARYNELVQIVDSLPERLSGIDERESDLLRKVESVDKEISMCERQLTALESAQDGEFSEDKLTELQQRLLDTRAVISQISSKVDELTESRRRIDKLGVGTCPHCLQKVTKAHLRRVHSSVTSQLESLLPVLEARKAEFTRLQEEIETLKAARRQVSSQKESCLSKLGALRVAREKLNSQLQKLREERSSLFEEQAKYQQELQQIEDQLRPLRRQLYVRRNRRSSLQYDISCFEQFAKACDAWIDFVHSDLPEIALSRVTPLFERFINSCLRVFSDFEVEMFISEGLPTFKLKDRDFNSVSTGELSRIFLALSLGAVLAARYIRGWSCNVLVLDEVFDSLDVTGRRNVYSLLEDIADRFSLCILVVTHHNDDVFPESAKVLSVVRENGKSTVVYEGG